MQSIVKDYRCCWRGYVGPWAAGVQKPSRKVIHDTYSDSAEDAVTSTPATDFYFYSDSKQSLFRFYFLCEHCLMQRAILSNFSMSAQQYRVRKMRT